MQCKKCSKFLPKKQEEHFTCKGACKGVFHKTCVPNYELSARTDKCGLCSSNAGDHKKITPQKLESHNMNLESTIKELNNKLEIVYEIQKNTNFYAEKYDELLRCHQETLEMLKDTNRKLQDVKNRCVHLETLNGALEIRVRSLEQAERSQNIEIIGVEYKEKENLKEVVDTIAQKLDVDSTGIERAWRLRGTKHNANSRGIIVKLRTEGIKQKWLDNRKKMHVNTDIFPNSTCSTKVFINEDLTKFNRELLWQAKQRKKENLLKYVWVKNGRVLCKKDDEDRTRVIHCSADLHAYINESKNG